MEYFFSDAVEFHIARQCAPVLTGVKPANILILKEQTDYEVCSCLEGTGISSYLLCEGKGRKIWLVYRKEELQKVIQKTEYRDFLKKEGYEGTDIDELIETLGIRFRMHQYGGEGFPHEMGIFLGYPLADVKGFIEHEGKDYLYQGYWKVYENVEERKRMFSVYNWVKSEVLKEMEKGKELWQAAISISIPPAVMA